MTPESASRPELLPGAPNLLTGPVSQVLAVLRGPDIETRIVGGAVRNHLLGVSSGDLDLATTAAPERVTQLCLERGWKVIPTGIDHGTVTVVVEHQPIEVTTLRADIETDGRRAVVAFGSSWEVDAGRRDFTMNAMSVDADGRLHDPIDGYQDLLSRRVRFIGDAALRIKEDYLRILRFFRFHARFGTGGPDADGLSAAINLRSGLRKLSSERVHQELIKLVMAERAGDTLSVMSESGILAVVLAGVGYLPAFARLEHIDATRRVAPDPVVRLAVLGVRVEEDASRLRDRLRLSNQEYRRLTQIARQWRSFLHASSENNAKLLLYRIGEVSYLDVVRVCWALSRAAADDTCWSRLVDLPRSWPVPVFPVSGQDLIDAGVPPGPTIGETLSRLEQDWIEAQFGLTADALIARV